MAFLGPILHGTVLNNHPPIVDYVPEVVEFQHKTTANYLQTHRIGYRYKFTLDWKNSLVTENMWEQLRLIINSNISYTFKPFPDKYPNTSFTVKVIDGVNSLSVFRYVGIGYKGKLMLETMVPVQTISQWI